GYASEAVTREPGVAEGFGVRGAADIAEYFVVCAVLFHDQYDVADRGWIRRGEAVLREEAVGGEREGGELLEIARGRHRECGDRAAVEDGTVLFIFQRASGIGTAAATARVDDKDAAVGDSDACGIEADRNVRDHDVACCVD